MKAFLAVFLLLGALGWVDVLIARAVLKQELKGHRLAGLPVGSHEVLSLEPLNRVSDTPLSVSFRIVEIEERSPGACWVGIRCVTLVATARYPEEGEEELQPHFAPAAAA